MPTSGRPSSSALDHATRQQLDELDALMQRMLALPVNPPEDHPNPPGQEPPRETAPESRNTSSAKAPGVEGSTSFPVTEPARPTQGKQARIEQDAVKPRADPSSADRPLALLPPFLDNWAGSSQAPPAPAENAFVGLEPPRQRKVELARPASTPQATPLRLALPLRPLWWINVGFDQGTALLGPIGGWLRGTGGRALLGWAGFLLLAAALAWIALDGMGWTW